MPDDAFEGGLDRNGKPIYIGQVYANFLIPAQIYSTGNKAYYEYAGMEYGVTENIKVSTLFYLLFVHKLKNNQIIILDTLYPASRTIRMDFDGHV